MRREAIVIELDPAALERLDPGTGETMGDEVRAAFGARLDGRPIRFEPYRMGSAFCGEPARRKNGVRVGFRGNGVKVGITGRKPTLTPFLRPA